MTKKLTLAQLLAPYTVRRVPRPQPERRLTAAVRAARAMLRRAA